MSGMPWKILLPALTVILFALLISGYTYKSALFSEEAAAGLEIAESVSTSQVQSDIVSTTTADILPVSASEIKEDESKPQTAGVPKSEEQTAATPAPTKAEEPGELNDISKKLQQLSISLEEYKDLVDSASLPDKDINLRTVVLIRCIYKSQYFNQSSQPAGEAVVSVGSGVFISEKAYILTAGHVVRDKSLGTDSSGRTWTLDGCEFAKTERYDTVIDANPKDYRNSPGFEPVEIVHEVTSDKYKDSAGIDLAILRPKNTSATADYASLYPGLVALPDDSYSVIAIGYPGKDGAIKQSIERFDGAFIDLQSFENSNCGLNKLSEVCGWRYYIGRAWTDVSQYFGYYTEYGKFSATAKGGFSGGPAFHKGNLIGIVTHGKSRAESGSYNQTGIDYFTILTSRDIARYLSTQGLQL